MKTQIEITEYEEGGKRGTVTYDEEVKKITVDFDHEKVTDVVNYLAKKREFKIPESGEPDDYRVDKAYPREHITYFELAMNTLFVNTGIWVDWSTQKEAK